MDLKENDRDLFERVSEKISQGKWETIGGMYWRATAHFQRRITCQAVSIRPDVLRKGVFGMRSSVAWLPDVFGFSWILPQIMKEAGIEYFSTTKLKWNEKNRFPRPLLVEGLDGSEIVCHFSRITLSGLQRNA